SPSRGRTFAEPDDAIFGRHLQQILFRNGNRLLTRRRERGVDVGENLKDLVEAGVFENGLDGFLNTCESEFAAVFLNLLHAFDEHGKTSAVQVRNFGKMKN